MVHFVYGRTGSGKSAYVYSLAESSAKERRAIILVPEREAVTAERDCAELAGAADMDIVTFSRLCNFIFRKKGGLCENYIGKGAKKIIMYNTLRALSPELSRYGAVSKNDSAIVEKLLAARSELYRNMILPEELSRAAEEFDGKPRISEKFADLAKVFAAYDANVAARWSEPDGAISRATDICGDYFENTDVYIDSFFTFTKEQYKLLSVIFSTANEVFVTLGYLPEYDREKSAFISLSETDMRLRRTAKEAGVGICDDVVLTRFGRYSNDELAFLAENMFSTPDVCAGYTEKPKNITVMNCANVYAEANAVAADVARRVREGGRYRDMAVIMRDTEDYTGIIDAALEKYEIPYFISRRTDIESKSLIRFIISAYACVSRNFRRNDIIDYIKTDYSGISHDECDLLENYITKWNVGGKKFTNDEPWTENPRGYEKTCDKDKEEISKINDIRSRVKAPLIRFAGALKTCGTVREHAVLLYDFLTYANVPETIKNDAEELRSIGDASGAAELVQLWDVFCDCLDQTVVSAGDDLSNADEFLTILRMCFSETDIGSIPTSVDEVLVGGASKIRPLSAKVVYLIGACDGVFPKRAEDDGIFSEYEKRLLETKGIEFSSRLEKNLSDELYYFYCSACSPSDELIVTYPEHSPSGESNGRSIAVKRIETVFPKLEEKRFEDIPSSELVYGVNAAMEYAISGSDAFAAELKEYFMQFPEYAERIKYSSEPLNAAHCRLSSENAETLFADSNSASYSRIEKYIECHFQYFCKYELDIPDDSRADFNDANIGSFIHEALESAVKYAVGSDFDEKKLKTVIYASAENYIASVTGKPAAEFPARLRHLTDYLSGCVEKFAVRIKEEFEQEGCKFKPMDYELSIGGKGGIKPIKIEDDGLRADIYGQIDRVDGFYDENGTLYVRVIDYKKSDRKFDIERIKLGLGLQLLLYLFSLWENGGEKYGAEIVPAGAMYYITNPKINNSTDEYADALEAGKTSGFVIAAGDDGFSIARAMEPGLNGKYTPIKRNALSGKPETKNLMGEQALADLKKEVIETVLNSLKEMHSGNADAAPLRKSKTDEGPCQYCKMKTICRIRTKGRHR